ncbi:hypothetical protein SAMN04487766_10958 [Actinomyces ruminicola]|uniref:Addiction module antidote protein, HigA family n=1 Tax=Actinomyces ruminicola TaxID=332524 RepID=A0A1G9XAB6_9ACTO|nr:hypothetical protein SAMN04487766_10958 [Actinomyces ruminicola]
MATWSSSGLTCDVFGVEPQFWLNLQSRYELELVEDRAADEFYAMKPIQAA